jgi:WD40 repeat protein
VGTDPRVAALATLGNMCQVESERCVANTPLPVNMFAPLPILIHVPPPPEDKFAVGSGEKSICICQFMEEFGAGGGWTSKSIKKCPVSGKSIKSTVLSVRWHPNNIMLICGCADMKCRIFTAYIKSVDGRKPPVGPFALDPADKKLKFGTCLAEYGQSKGWVHDAAFSPSGSCIAFVGHDSSIHFAPIPSEPVCEIQNLPIVAGCVPQEHSL